MDRELEAYYERQFDMMSHEGWKDLMATVETMRDKEANILTVKDYDDLLKRQGRLDILNWLANWKQTCEQVYKDNQDA